jgi:hypothetical protein
MKQNAAKGAVACKGSTSVIRCVHRFRVERSTSSFDRWLASTAEYVSGVRTNFSSTITSISDEVGNESEGQEATQILFWFEIFTSAAFTNALLPNSSPYATLV